MGEWPEGWGASMTPGARRELLAMSMTPGEPMAWSATVS